MNSNNYNPTNLVIGLGQIGTAVKNVIGQLYEVDGIDLDQQTDKTYDFVHVCIPYTDAFVDAVKAYKAKYLVEGGVLIVHSTVPVGTSYKVKAVHSPIRGIHPHLEKGIRGFVKFFGGKHAEQAAELFRNLGVRTKTTKYSENTEALKLWDTTQYAWAVLLEKHIHEWCQQNGLDFEVVYTQANETYNSGYEMLGHPEYAKYVLKHQEGPIGGHCLIPNCLLLGDDPIAKQVLTTNEQWKQ